MIDEALILKLEQLAQLELDSAERLQLRRDLEAVLSMIHRINQQDTTGVAPLVYLHENKGLLRRDAISGQIDTADALANAPDRIGEYFTVPVVVHHKNTKS